jgi:hypothetical protein
MCAVTFVRLSNWVFAAAAAAHLQRELEGAGSPRLHGRHYRAALLPGVFFADGEETEETRRRDLCNARFRLARRGGWRVPQSRCILYASATIEIII